VQQVYEKAGPPYASLVVVRTISQQDTSTEATPVLAVINQVNNNDV